MDKNINYKGIFWAGFTIMVSGVVMTMTLGPVGIAILGSGNGLMAVGLAHRDEWDKG